MTWGVICHEVSHVYMVRCHMYVWYDIHACISWDVTCISWDVTCIHGMIYIHCARRIYGMIGMRCHRYVWYHIHTHNMVWYVYTLHNIHVCTLHNIHVCMVRCHMYVWYDIHTCCTLYMFAHVWHEMSQVCMVWYTYT